jgi:hypothetical protein
VADPGSAREYRSTAAVLVPWVGVMARRALLLLPWKLTVFSCGSGIPAAANSSARFSSFLFLLSWAFARALRSLRAACTFWIGVAARCCVCLRMLCHGARR